MKVLISDYDGTLFLSEDDIKNNASKIKKFRKQGNMFIICTARNFAAIKKPCVEYGIDVDYFFCDIGSVILDNDGKVIYRKYIDIEDRNQIESILDNMENQVFIKRYGTNNKQGKEITDIVEYKIEGEKSILKEIKEKVDKNCKLRTKITEDNKLIIHTNTKEESIEIFIKEMKIDRDCVYTVGDELDDLEMLKKYNGYRMDKCNDILKEYITKSVSNISELIDIIGE